MIFRPELVENILAGETEAARILEPGYVGSVRCYHSLWRKENRAAWGTLVLEQATRIERTAAELASEHWGWLEVQPLKPWGHTMSGRCTVCAHPKVEAIDMALDAGAALPDEPAEKSGLAPGTVQNCLTRLRKHGDVEDTGQVKGRARQVRLSSSSSSFYMGSDDDDAVERAAREDEELLRTGRIQSESQVFELAREHSMNGYHPEREE